MVSLPSRMVRILSNTLKCESEISDVLGIRSLSSPSSWSDSVASKIG